MANKIVTLLMHMIQFVLAVICLVQTASKIPCSSKQHVLLSEQLQLGLVNSAFVLEENIDQAIKLFNEYYPRHDESEDGLI